MKLGPLQWGLIGAAALLIVVMAPSDKEDEAASRPTKQHGTATLPAVANQNRQRASSVGRVELERLAKLVAQQNVEAVEANISANAFDNTSWYIAPPPPRREKAAPPSLPLPPPAPTAPPLPFTYMGRYVDSDSLIIVLLKDDRIYTATEGEVIDSTYRMEKATPGKVNLTYLPLNTKQFLRTGDAL
jgi:hypothetical protein